MGDRLGILVNTDRHPDYVDNLTRGAVRCRKKVHLHFMGEGLVLAGLPAIAALGRLEDVVLTAEGHPPDTEVPGPAGSTVQSTVLADFFRACDRFVIF